MGAGFFGLLAGGFLGYHLATRDRPEHAYGWGSGRGWGRCQQQHQGPQGPVPVDASYPSEKAPFVAQQNLNVAPDEYALFQQWKQQQSTYAGARSPAPALNQASAYNMESVKATAVESADKALDALLSQVQVMKEKLAQHKAVVERTVPSTPHSEAGDYKLV
ncbi:hypothetical protein P389DRAFT_195766 [Cystobasidium minutum MCA 4210]|uniref:uncharacterized protein n=1 Tax=Cystobasidium minutum MCA 4210 TaxID=1397322 RepID=UPI0034CE06E0|eukprot:jgi/Rhomi1/195766/gm1.3980_g